MLRKAWGIVRRGWIENIKLDLTEKKRSEFEEYMNLFQDGVQ
jgi:hypothetical protein